MTVVSAKPAPTTESTKSARRPTAAVCATARRINRCSVLDAKPPVLLD